MAISQDTQVTLLLCGVFLKQPNNAVMPFTPTEYDRLAGWLTAKELLLTDLLSPDSSTYLEELEAEHPRMSQDRVLALLDRGMALGMAVEEWQANGCWVIGRTDSHYPDRYEARIGRSRPPLLYGIGNPELLSQGGIAVVGSRSVDEAGSLFAHQLARKAAAEGMQIISGGANGVDSEAMLTAMDEGGCTVGVLAGNLRQEALSPRYRTALRGGSATLISPYHPDAGFSPGVAMGRNKLIYTLADFAVVVASGAEQGGTWAGATENLRQGWIPLFVRSEGDVPEGNVQLIERGGIPIDSSIFDDEPGLLAQLTPQMEPTFATRGPMTDPLIPYVLITSSSQPADLFSVVWPLLAERLHEPIGERELWEWFPDVRLVQLRDWLAIAVERGHAVRLERPIRYVVKQRNDGQLSLDLDS